MTRKRHEEPHWPTPLRERNGELGKIVRDYVQDTEDARGEAAAYTHVLARTTAVADGRRSWGLPVLIASLTVALLSGMVFLRHRAGGAPSSTGAAASRTSKSQPSVVTVQPQVQPVATLPPPGKPFNAEAAPSARSTFLHLGDQPASLPTGRVDLDGQAMAVVSSDAVASGRTQEQDTEIALKKGTLELHVLPRAKGHGFAVRAGLYQFTVVGTAFTVAQTRSRLELVVREGKVAVSRGTTRLTTVAAGGTWAVDLPALALAPSLPAAPAMPAPAPVMAAPPSMPTASSLVAGASAPVPRLAPPALDPALAGAPSVVAPLASPRVQPPLAFSTGTEHPRAAAPLASAQVYPDCAALSASKREREALACYQEQATQGGLAGETAQYEVARLWRDSFGEPTRALAAFKAQRTRFPRGALRTEADLSIIELLPRLGRHTEAMAETEQFLLAHPKAERRGEIHLLRGNIYREVLHDFQQAEREYARGAESGGSAGDDCRFLRAACLEAVGRVDEARKAYGDYLQFGRGAHVNDAKKRLDRLRP
jgi:hypothetical protein